MDFSERRKSVSVLQVFIVRRGIPLTCLWDAELQYTRDQANFSRPSAWPLIPYPSHVKGVTTCIRDLWYAALTIRDLLNETSSYISRNVSGL